MSTNIPTLLLVNASAAEDLVRKVISAIGQLACIRQETTLADAGACIRRNEGDICLYITSSRELPPESLAAAAEEALIPFVVIGDIDALSLPAGANSILISEVCPEVLACLIRNATTAARQTHREARMRVLEDLRLREDAIRVSSNGVVILDCRQDDMPIVYANPAFEAITGYSVEECLGRNPRFLLNGVPDQAALKVLQRAVSEGTNTSVVLLNRRKDGAEFWNELQISPIVAPDGKVTHYVGIQNDITYRMLMEKALCDSEERLNNILSSLNDIVYSMSLTGAGEILYVSPVFRKVTGLTPDEVYSQHLGWQDLVLPEDHPIVLKAMATALEEGKSEAQFRIRHKDGSIRWIYDRAVLATDTRGNPQSIDGIASDITEPKRLREKIVQAEKLAALGELVAGVAHEINNPLAMISGHAQMIQQLGDDDVKEDADAIVRMTKRASEIVRNLLRFARRQDSERQQGSLNAAIEAAIELGRYRLDRHGVALDVNLSPNLPKIVFNATEIEQVILNVFTNADYALQSVPTGERRIGVRSFKSESSGRKIAVIEIADSGGGIPDDVLPRVFDPFFTTKDIGEGTGLGLSICHGIVQAHGGTIRATSRVAAGTTITIELPATD
ncbi:MAG: PAS domain S-box protein [Capsulimonadaceae bacterium]|nr:PAS domain S-box protein [Capsulimonadaceae bacterium]